MRYNIFDVGRDCMIEKYIDLNDAFWAVKLWRIFNFWSALNDLESRA